MKITRVTILAGLLFLLPQGLWAGWTEFFTDVMVAGGSKSVRNQEGWKSYDRDLNDGAGGDYIYSDTDSIKIFNPESHMDYINWYNDRIMRKVEKAAKHFGIDSTEYAPKNKKGVPKPIGVWDYEGKYKRFKTLGAKRYLFERYEEDINPEKGKYRYVLTVAGVNKEKACRYLVEHFGDPFDGFTHELCVPPEYSGRLTLTYVDHPCHGVMKDYLGNEVEYYEESFIHMEPSDYNLTISNEYRSFLQFIYGVKEDSW